MSLQHTDRDIQKLKIHKFDNIEDFELAQQQGYISQDDISIINEEVQVDWNQTDPDAPDFIKNKPESMQGIQGLQGIQGIQGIKGIQGLTGFQGIQGIQGTKGLQGLTGSQGTRGIQGLIGLQGTQGIKGLQGLQGLQGLTGSQGTQGTKGLQGIQGIQGIQGTKGLQGLTGSQGTQGIQGLQGIKGSQGIQGIQGLQGITGSQGTQGIQGLQGIQGVKGSQGTQGIQGLQGITGSQGTQGIQGLQGLQGITGSQGTQGTQGIQGLQGEIGSQGIQGTKGLQGLQGIQGIQGFIGSQGTQGIQGLQGIKGSQGIQGLQGRIGSQGIQGLQGLRGYQGIQGLQGIRGYQGLQGIQGLKGYQGIQGFTGIQGLQGMQGSGFQAFKFNTIQEFQQAQEQGLIGENDLSIITEQESPDVFVVELYRTYDSELDEYDFSCSVAINDIYAAIRQKKEIILIYHDVEDFTNGEVYRYLNSIGDETMNYVIMFHSSTSNTNNGRRIESSNIIWMDANAGITEYNAGWNIIYEYSNFIPNTLQSLSGDVNISSPTDNQILKYDNTTSKWVNGDIPTETFLVTLTRNTSGTGGWIWNCDKTWAEIYAAHNSGKFVYMLFNQYVTAQPTGFELYKAHDIHENNGSFYNIFFNDSYPDHITCKLVNYNNNNNPAWSFISSEYGYTTDKRVRIYRNITGTAAVTTSPYYCSRWDVTDTSVSYYEDGMVVCLKVPVAGNSTYGTGFQINNLGYKPVVYNINTMIGTRYGVGSVVWAVYNSTQTGNLHLNSDSATTVTGCWQVNDYGTSDTNTIGYLLRTNSSTRPVAQKTYRYRILFSSPDNTKWIPSNTSSSTNATAVRTVNQEKINPFGRIIYYSTTTAINANANIGAGYQCDQYPLSLGYSFNRTGAALVLTYPAPVYIKCAPQSDGSAIIDADTPYVQVLPSTADGKIYIYLGQAYSETNIELTYDHPIYYHDGTQIRQYSGDVVGLTNHDFTALSAPTITSNTTTITFVANQRNNIEFSTNDDLSIALISNNKSDNYMWITNSNSNDSIDITFSSISFGATTINDIKGTDSIPSIPVGKTLELGVYIDNNKARITSIIL